MESENFVARVVKSAVMEIVENELAAMVKE